MKTRRSEQVGRLTAPGQPLEIGEEATPHGRRRRFPRALATIPALCDHACDTFGEHPFLVFGEERRSFAAVDAEAALLARGLRELAGVGRGDRVAIAMRNYPEWVVAFIAAQRLGAIPVGINAWWTAPELAAALDDCAPRAVLADRERLERLRHGGDFVAIAVRAPAGDRPGTLAYTALLERGSLAEAEPVSPDDDALILYTSGSTAAPKGVVSTHRAVMHALHSWRLDSYADTLAAGGALPNERAPQGALLLAIPLFHVSGSHVGMLSSLLIGRRLVLMYKWDADAAVRIAQAEGITFVTGPAAVTGDLMAAVARAGTSLDTLTGLGGGGAPRPPEQVRSMATLVPTAEPNIGWGMTETNAIGSGHSGDSYRERPTSSGLGSQVLDFRIVREDGSVAGIKENGELQVRGASLFDRYWRKPAETTAAFQDGWFRTGDVARFDADGHLYIVDRLKDMVLRGGENISCPQVEAALAEHPAVLEVAVFGLPDVRLGEMLAATVVPRPGTRVTPDALRAFAGERLAAFQVPQEVSVEGGPLPRTASGKIDKRAIRDARLAASRAAAA